MPIVSALRRRVPKLSAARRYRPPPRGVLWRIDPVLWRINGAGIRHAGRVSTSVCRMLAPHARMSAANARFQWIPVSVKIECTQALFLKPTKSIRQCYFEFIEKQRLFMEKLTPSLGGSASGIVVCIAQGIDHFKN